MDFGYGQLYEQLMGCTGKKEKRLRKLKNKSGSDVVINANCEFLNRLKGNDKDYFYILDTIWNNNNVEYIAFSPKQAFDIYDKFNIYTQYTHFHEIILPLTKGYCKIVGNNKKENKKILFLNNSMTRVLYQINSTEKINKLLSWLKEILQIGGYIAEDVKGTKQTQSIEFIIDNAKRTTECYINGELKGRAIANPKEEIDDRMGKLVSFIRALEFSKDTEKRLINNLFITETELEDVTKLKEKNKKLEKQRDILFNTINKIKGKLCKTYLEVVEVVHDINNDILFDRD